MEKVLGVPSNVVKSEVFAARRNVLCSYGYGLVRHLEFSSAWVASSSDIGLKVALGRVAGLTGECIGRIQDRLASLLTAEFIPLASDAYARKLDEGVTCETVEEKAGFLVRLLQGLRAHMEGYIADTNPIGDAPTVVALTEILRLITEQIRALAGFLSAEPVASAGWEPSTTAPVVYYEGTEPAPRLVDKPARPPHWRHSNDQILSHKSYEDLLERGEHKRRWLHQVGIDVEINAMELCGRNIVEFRTMDLAFKLDMARQLWDETRHAQMMRLHLNALGADFGDYTYSDKVWTKYMLGDTLAERLAIQQIYQEGNALEANLPYCERLVEASHHDLAEMLDYVDADELRHAYYGNKWLKTICGGDRQEYIRILRVAAQKLGMPLAPRAPLQVQLRQMADYPEEFIQLLAEAE